MDSPGSQTTPQETADPVGDPEVLIGDRYRVGRTLGRGGAAQVHAAVDQVLGREVAVKIFRPTDETELASSDREVRVLAGLSHPGLVMVYDAGTDGDPEDGGRPYIVMELVDGPSLAGLLKEHGARPAEEVAEVGRQVAEALAYVHEHGLIHRDVKPGNLLLELDDDGTVTTAKLADFGIARFTDSTRHTMTGTTLGTAPYLSPEQVRGADLAQPTDVYSLGLVLLEALTGRVEYPGSAVESAVARLHRRPQVPGELGYAWGRLLRAMTDDDPVRRPAASEVAAALASIDAAEDDEVSTAALLLPTTQLPAVAAPTAAAPAVGADAFTESSTHYASPGRRLAAAARRTPELVTGPRRVRTAVVAVLAVLALTGIALSAQGRSTPDKPVQVATTPTAEPTTTPSVAPVANRPTSTTPARRTTTHARSVARTSTKKKPGGKHGKGAKHDD